MKKNNPTLLSLFSFLLCYSITMNAQKQFLLKAPGGKLEASISVGTTIEYSVSHDGDLILAKSSISMTMIGGNTFGM